VTINYKQCLKCGSKNSIKIVYGYPSHELFLEAEAGKVKLGGCCISIGDPGYFCNDCEYTWNREQAIDAAYSKIKVLKASVGGYLDAYYHVVVDLENRNTIWNFSPFGEEKKVEKTIRKRTAEQFIDQLKIVDLLNWKSKYVEPYVCDGTHWSVEIITEKRTIKKYGDNKFPKEWEMFCSLIKRVTGKTFS
jgi:hypothetical protein